MNVSKEMLTYRMMSLFEITQIYPYKVWLDNTKARRIWRIPGIYTRGA